MEETLIKDLVANNQEILLIEKEVSKRIAVFEDNLKQLKAKEAQIKDAIKQAMEKNNVKKFENDLVSITYIAEMQRKILDTVKLKENEPQIFEKYLKVSNVGSSIRILIKKVELRNELKLKNKNL